MTRSMRGFSLLEALVALAILTLGLFGAAALQSAMVRAQRDAAHHALAAALAAELADLLILQPAAEHWLGNEPAVADAPDCYHAACPADVMAAFTTAHWHWRASEALPGVRAALTGVCCGSARQLVLTWPSAHSEVPRQTFVLPVDMPA